MDITPEIRVMLNETKDNLSGYKCRHFMAQVVETMLDGSPTKAEKKLGWNRVTLAKALNELRGGFCFIDHYHLRGRKRAEDHLPALLDDIQELAGRYRQTLPFAQPVSTLDSQRLPCVSN